MAWIFGLLGAVAAVLYALSDGSPHAVAAAAAGWLARAPELLIYAASGFVIGWVVGFALSKVGGGE